jgi:hypothetical protein
MKGRFSQQGADWCGLLYLKDFSRQHEIVSPKLMQGVLLTALESY